MRKGAIMTILIIIILLISGCSNDIESFSREKEELINRISELEEEISKRDEEIKELKDLAYKANKERDELEERIDMIRFSAYARFDDYDFFHSLENMYKINTKHAIIADWYVIQEESFELELLGYEGAKKVDFYVLRLESCEGERLLFSDTDYEDGWKYTNDNIGKVIEKHYISTTGGISYGPCFVIFAEVILNDGNTVKTPKLPIYYR